MTLSSFPTSLFIGFLFVASTSALALASPYDTGTFTGLVTAVGPATGIYAGAQGLINVGDIVTGQFWGLNVRFTIDSSTWDFSGAGTLNQVQAYNGTNYSMGFSLNTDATPGGDGPYVTDIYTDFTFFIHEDLPNPTYDTTFGWIDFSDDGPNAMGWSFSASIGDATPEPGSLAILGIGIVFVGRSRNLYRAEVN